MCSLIASLKSEGSGAMMYAGNGLRFEKGAAALLVAVLVLSGGCQTVREIFRPEPEPPEVVAPPAHVPPPEPAEPGVGYSEVGEASWYGAAFDGNKTASGDIFDADGYTAAHRTLPFGTRVRVTNLETGQHVDVVINDRGPHAAGRMIDLSRAAGQALGIQEEGVQRVRMEILAMGQ
jgi:rare lipoprotein A